MIAVDYQNPTQYIFENYNVWNLEEVVDNHSEEPSEYCIPIEDWEIEFLKNCVQAEAGGESDEAKRGVCDVILNRVLSPSSPDSVYGVITQKYRFTSYWDGGMERHKEISDSTSAIVEEELKAGPLHNNWYWFTSDGYGRNGKPICQIGNMYFGG